MRVVLDDRASNDSGLSSVGLIAGYIPRGHAAWNNSLVQVIVQPDGGGPPLVATHTNLQLNITAGGDPVQGNPDPDPASPLNLTISSAEPQLLWRMEGDACRVVVKFYSASLLVECEGPPKLWGARGPEGGPTLGVGKDFGGWDWAQKEKGKSRMEGLSDECSSKPFCFCFLGLHLVLKSRVH